ncbi:nitrite reductase [Nocardioides sp. KR10-350]|uniref:nitrite reductase n=1 Tax=Nocardioides cheoyonin TaxID=3156615 RepID=UPI0032B3D31F
MLRTRRDRCPGALRPWPAEDGLLVRLRLIGGRLPAESLRRLVDVAEEYGDGRVRLTGRANLQLRGLPARGGALTPEVLAAVEATGLLPSRTHELIRNVMVSPQTGLAGGRVDLRPVAADLDRRLCASPRLAQLPGRFLFVLDDGRGDLRDRPCDLGLVALDATRAQLRVGERWGPVVALADAAGAVARLAGTFVDRRGCGPTAAWHVAELRHPLAPEEQPDGRLPAPAPPPAYGVVPGGRHIAVPDGLDRRTAEAVAAEADELVVTPWRGVLVPEVGR